jgi:uncharacterized RDD family membrane protein YckC
VTSIPVRDRITVSARAGAMGRAGRDNDTMADVVTGEAVVLEVRVAQAPARVLAQIIDVTVQLALMIGVYFLLGTAAIVMDPALERGLTILLSVLFIVGYPVIFESLTTGRSPGKMALGLRVVGDDGGPELFRQALVRGLASVLEIWALAGAGALICSLVSAKGKRLGDLFAGTIVIGERGPAEPPPPPMPPQLEAWAATLELALLPDEVANTARRFLARRHQLAPAVQSDMGTRIAAQMMAYVTPPPPPETPTPAYLAAVLAERRRRGELRLARTAPGASVPQGHPAPDGGAAPAAPPSPAAPVPPLAMPPSGEAPPTPGGFLPPV